jgi:hypothetical protein
MALSTCMWALQIPGNFSFESLADQEPRIALHADTLHDTISYGANADTEQF